MEDQLEMQEGMRRIGRLRFRIGRLLTGIACLSAAAAFIIAFSLLAWYDGIHTRNTAPEPFNAFQESRDCSVDIQLLAGPFASTQDDKQTFYWGYGLMMEPVMVLFTGELPEECRALVEYTHNPGITEIPEPVTIRGRSVSIENTDIYDYALEFYQTMWGLAPMERNEFKQTVASYYLDSAKQTWLKKLPWYGTLLVFFLPVVFFVTGFSECRRFAVQKKREQKRLSVLSEEEMQTAVRQLAGASEFEPRSRIYVTADYVITGNYQFDIIPYARITSIEETGGFLIAVTGDGAAHILLSSGHKKPDRISWLNRLKKVLEEKIIYAKIQGEHYAVISGN
ncbi:MULTISPECIES: hypothetical protein [Hungatella]|uniref:hypothetical protein n=1 Tax=Hungatella TaxID=1649459 RepID=UPI0011DCDFE0|nr:MULTISPECIES: hypothetical protein [Hungatella]MCI6454535.1 hypothetical protein [Hungatella sp.]